MAPPPILCVYAPSRVVVVALQHCLGMTLGTVTYTVNGVDTVNPAADADGFNSGVTAIKVAMDGVFENVCSGPHSFQVKFRAGVE